MAEKKKVLVAMSGGVDSSVCASLLLEQGYDVTGVTMEIWPDLGDGEVISQGCCSISAIEDARKVAEYLGIPFEVWNFQDEFNKCVITPFINEYINGRTPNPCVVCNATVKFGQLLERAIIEGYDYVATGHYGLIDELGDRLVLKRAVTVEKDQTYALYNLTQHQMKHLLLPVGNMTKPQVREYAKNKNIPVFDKPDSQEICFVRDNDYAGFIERAGYTCKPGNFIDTNGNVIGKHKGVFHYTIGQRKGLGGTFGKPMFVVDINVADNTVMLGDNKDTFKNALYATNLNWITFERLPDEGISVYAKIRYNGPASACHVISVDEDKVKVEFDSPVRAVTPGQSVVFYNGDVVVGGGVIK